MKDIKTILPMMVIIKYIFVITTMIITHLSCSQFINSNKNNSLLAEEKNTDVEVLHCLNCSKDSSIRDEHLPYDYLKIIKLDTNDDCLIDGLRKIEFKDSLIFYLDRRESLYVFNEDGKFITKVGNKGQGPLDFIRINFFFVDNQKRIVILDAAKGVFLYYDYNGRLLFSQSAEKALLNASRYELNENLTFSTNALLTNNNTLLINKSITWRSEHNMAYAIVDLNKKEWINTNYTYNPIQLDHYTHTFINTMIKVDDEIHFIMPLCDTIYSFSNSSFSPKYIVKTFDKLATKHQLEPNCDFLIEVSRLQKQGFFTGFNAIFETENIILLEYQQNALQFFIFDKTTKEGYFYVYSSDEHISEIPFFRIIHALPNDQFVGISLIDGLIEMVNDAKGNNKYVAQLREILANSEEDDNPLLFIYGFNYSHNNHIK